MESGGIRFILRSLDGPVVIQREDTNECRQTSHGELINAIQSGLVVCEGVQPRPAVFAPTGDLMAKVNAMRVTEQAIAVWWQKMSWLSALRARGIERIVDEAWVRVAIKRASEEEMKGVPRFEISTLYAADLQIRKADGDITAAIPRYDRRGGALTSRLDPKTKEIIDASIRRSVEGEGRIVCARIEAEILTEIRALNAQGLPIPIPEPGSTTIRREFDKQVPKHLITLRNHGKHAAAKQFRQNSYPRDRARYPLEVVEYDDIDCGVFLVDEDSGLPWGRAYLTNGVDQNTEVPQGYDLSEKHRDFHSAIGALCDSLLPKTGDDLDPFWDGYGVPGTPLLDNAVYNKCRAMMTQSRGLSILLASAKPFGPTEKSTIEHFNAVIKEDFCADLPGWRGDKGDPDALKEGMASAALTLQEFRRRYKHWVCHTYLNKPGVDGYTPRQRWKNFYRHHGPAIRYSREQLSLFRLRPVEQLTFRDSGGLLLLRLRYDSDELTALRRHLGGAASVAGFVDDYDLGYLIVVNPNTQQLLRVPCIEDARYVRGLTHKQQSLILKMCRQRGIKNPSMMDMVDSRKELAKLIAQSLRSNKLRKSAYAKRTGNPAMNPADETSLLADMVGAQVAPMAKVVTEVEYQVQQLEEISLEDE